LLEYFLASMEWNIQSRAHVCQSCKKPFADKEPFHTMLFDQRSGYERLDVCANCWQAQFSQGATDRKGFVSHWQSVYNIPPAAPPEPIQRETAETLLRKLLERNEPEYGPTIYILAAMLERKRILKVKTQISRDNQRVFVYEHTRSGELIQVTDPNLQLQQLEGVQHEVLKLLQQGLGDTPVAQSERSASEASDSDAGTAPVTQETEAPGRALGLA
jgi:hypothetical protein